MAEPKQCPAGIRGQSQAGELQRRAVRHFQHAMLRAETMAIEAGRATRGERQLVAGDVVGVRVRHKAPRLPAAHIDAQLGGGQE